jgi:hypothetical protein
MRSTTKLLSIFGLIAFMVWPTIGAAMQDMATPEAGAVEGSSAGPVIGDTVTYVDENGNGIADITVDDVVRGWQDHDDDEPDGGYEYVAVTVTVDSTIARGSFDVDDSDLRLQDTAGFMWDRVGVAVPEEATLLPLDGDQQLPTGESVTFLVVFEVLAGQQLDHLFWSPGSDRILTLASVADI